MFRGMRDRRQGRRQQRYDEGGGLGRRRVLPRVFPGRNYRGSEPILRDPEPPVIVEAEPDEGRGGPILMPIEEDAVHDTEDHFYDPATGMEFPRGKEVFDPLDPGLDTLADFAGAAARNIGQGANAVVRSAGELGADAGSGAGRVIGGLLGKIVNAGGDIGDTIAAADKAIGGPLDALGRTIRHPTEAILRADEAAGGPLDAIGGAVRHPIDTVSRADQALGGPMDALGGALLNPIDTATSVLDSIGGAVLNPIDTAVGALDAIGGTILSPFRTEEPPPVTEWKAGNPEYDNYKQLIREHYGINEESTPEERDAVRARHSRDLDFNRDGSVSAAEARQASGILSRGGTIEPVGVNDPVASRPDGTPIMRRNRPHPLEARLPVPSDSVLTKTHSGGGWRKATSGPAEGMAIPTPKTLVQAGLDPGQAHWVRSYMRKHGVMPSGESARDASRNRLSEALKLMPGASEERKPMYTEREVARAHSRGYYSALDPERVPEQTLQSYLGAAGRSGSGRTERKKTPAFSGFGRDNWKLESTARQQAGRGARGIVRRSDSQPLVSRVPSGRGRPDHNNPAHWRNTEFTTDATDLDTGVRSQRSVDSDGNVTTYDVDRNGQVVPGSTRRTPGPPKDTRSLADIARDVRNIR